MSISYNVLIRMCIWHIVLCTWKINIFLPFVSLSAFLLIYLVPQAPYKISLILFKLVNLQTPKVQCTVTFKVWIITSKIHIWTNISAGIHYKNLGNDVEGSSCCLVWEAVWKDGGEPWTTFQDSWSLGHDRNENMKECCCLASDIWWYSI